MIQQETNATNLTEKIDPKLKEALTKELADLKYKKATVEQLKKYIEKGISIETKDGFHETPLIKSILADNMPVAKYLISQSANMYATNLSGQTSMMLCAKKGWLEVVKELFERGYDINQKVPSTHQSVLSVAVWAHQTEVVSWLLENGADVNRTDNLGWTALMIAAYCGYQDIVIELLKYNPDILCQNVKGMSAQDLAKFYNHEDIVEILLSKLQQT